MKKIYFSIVFLLSSLIAFSQVDTKKIHPYYHLKSKPANWEDSLRKAYKSLQHPDMDENEFVKINDNLFAEMQVLKKGLQFQMSTGSTHTPCGDGNFENDIIGGAPNTSEWEGAFGSSGAFSTTGFSSDAIITSGVGRQTIVGNTLDPTGAPIQTVHSGNKAIRLGNQLNGYGNELLRKTFTVSSSNSIYSFWYACVMNYPTNPVHTTANQPGFWVDIKDASGTPITGLVDLGNGSNMVTANSPMLITLPNILVYATEVRYQPWACVSIDLSNCINQTITIEFKNRDCTMGGHFGYTYLDDICAGCAGSPSGSVSIAAISDTCFKSNNTASICADYTLPTNGTSTGTTQIDLQIYQNGALVNTITGPTFSTGTQYCFTITTAALNGKTGCFDVRVVGHFKIGTFNLPTQYSNATDGWKPGLNNDLCICNQPPSPPKPCCNIPKLKVGMPVNEYRNDYGSYYGTSFNLPINTGTARIQEIRASVISFEASYENPECAKCYTPYNTMGTLKLTNMDPSIPPLIHQNLGHYTMGTDLGSGVKGVREIVWSGGPAVVGSVNPEFEILYPKPRMPKCCNIKIKACIKFIFKDADCNVCEKIICYDSDSTGTPTACSCGNWKSKKVKISNMTTTKTIQCGDNPTIPAGSYTITFPAYNCNPSTSACSPTYTWKIESTSGLFQNGTGNTASYNFTLPGHYTVKTIVSCNGKPCDSCSFSINIIGGPVTCPCNVSDSVLIMQNGGLIQSLSVSCGGIANVQLVPGMQIWVHPSITCTCGAAATSTTMQVTKNGGTPQVLTSPNFAHPITTTGLYEFQISSACNGTQCSCNLKIQVTP